MATLYSTPHVTEHINAVYTFLFWLFCVFGSTMFIASTFTLENSSLISIVAFIGALFSIFSIFTADTSGRPYSYGYNGYVGKRSYSALVLAGCMGLMSAPTIIISNMIDPSIIIEAFIGTALMFGSLVVASKYIQFTDMYTTGMFLTSSLQSLFYVSILALITGSELLYSIELFGGLLLFAGYVIYDMHKLEEHANLIHTNPTADREYYMLHDAVNIFLDLVNIFIRLVRVLAKSRAKSIIKKSS